MTPKAPLLLVIEDDPDVSEGMCSLLEEEGYEVLPALDGLRGLQLLRERPGVELVLLDLTMPNMNAVDFRAEQRRDPLIAQVPVLVMSAGLDVGRQAQLLGAAAHLGKPFKPTALLEAVARIVGAHARQAHAG